MNQRRSHPCGGLLLCLLLLNGARGDEPARWGASVESALFETCVPFFCQGGAILGEIVRQSFESRLRSDATAPFGSASMEVELVRSGRINLPRFSGQAITTGPSIRWCSAAGTVVEGFRFTGQTNTVLQFAFNLHGTSSATNAWDGVKMELYLCRAPGFRFSEDIGWLLFESGIEIAARREVSVHAVDGDRPQTGILEVSVSPGERFYLVARCSVGIFQVGGMSQLLSPAEVTCLNPESLISESEEEEVPLMVARAPEGLRFSWGPTRRSVQLQRAPDLNGETWLPVTGTPASTVFGSRVDWVPGDGASYFRLKID